MNTNQDESKLLKQIALGEDSVLELKEVEFSGKKVVGPNKDSMADELAAMANFVPGTTIDDLNPKLWQKFHTVLSSKVD